MRIEICPTLQPEDENFRQAIVNTITETISSAVNVVEANPDDIDAVILVSQDDFGPTVNRLQVAAGQPESYTDNGIHVAAAKTLAAMRDGRVVSTVVYRDNFMAEILGDVMGVNGDPTFGEGAQFCFYLLAHELGHCKDNALRSDVGGSESRFQGGFSVEKVTNHYRPVVLSELAACVHSALAMRQGTYDQEWKRWHEDTGQYLSQLKNSWRTYQRDNSLLGNLAFDAAQVFWIMLLQYSKLVGSRIGNPNLVNGSESFQALNGDVVSALKDADATLRQIWNSYPAWTNTTGNDLLPHWQKLAQLYGYKFVQGQEGDALYLDNSIITRY